MKIENHEAVFSTGKKRSANCGIIGIDTDLHVFEGYDSGFYINDDDESWRDKSDHLSKAELIELSDYMIEQWQKFRALHEGIDK